MRLLDRWDDLDQVPVVRMKGFDDPAVRGGQASPVAGSHRSQEDVTDLPMPENARPAEDRVVHDVDVLVPPPVSLHVP